MFDIYSAVTAGGLPIFMGACIPLLSNFDFEEWDKLIHSDLDRETVLFLKFGFPASYAGLVPTPSQANHASASAYTHYIQ